MKKFSFLANTLGLTAVALALPVHADVGKVYHPYVEPLEREIELQARRSFDDMDQHENTYSIGYGQALNEKIFVELSVDGQESSTEHFDTSRWELEGLFQLSEQGAGPVDYAILLEAEREPKANISEIASFLLLESEIGQSSLTANLGLSFEFGSGIDNEYDRFGRVQWRYRLKPALEPAFEIHADEYDKAAGPALLGRISLPRKQKIRWELGYLFGLDDETPASLLKASLEFEF